MIRAHIRLNTTIEAQKFVSLINSDGTVDKYMLQNDTGKLAVEARSLLGVIYMMTDQNDKCYLVNETEDGRFPHGIDIFRV